MVFLVEVLFVVMSWGKSQGHAQSSRPLRLPTCYLLPAPSDPAASKRKTTGLLSFYSLWRQQQQQQQHQHHPWDRHGDSFALPRLTLRPPSTLPCHIQFHLQSIEQVHIPESVQRLRFQSLSFGHLCTCLSTNAAVRGGAYVSSVTRLLETELMTPRMGFQGWALPCQRIGEQSASHKNVQFGGRCGTTNIQVMASVNSLLIRQTSRAWMERRLQPLDLNGARPSARDYSTPPEYHPTLFLYRSTSISTDSGIAAIIDHLVCIGRGYCRLACTSFVQSTIHNAVYSTQ
ncbi:hypothetical protein EJ05DRAFT_539610 [Pseudovirgaria hyperparasitica]|uniref:Secreted protein n=1 Tax=Pseudovirgaria hyperparasitica TaxID=470096 RepID=A0A6A6W3V8_9PEZI|nr:uncharacterized protein EJ05DRAFT_539610 [Pseudovirgaria hyperparasitica]KAF2756714.1 hypothetical protein EJ05DRAFT_539610 [Pseudovirgaria hyperparasitica]